MSLLNFLQRLRIMPHENVVTDEVHELFADNQHVIQTVLAHFPELRSTTISTNLLTSEEAAATVSRRQWQNYAGTQVAQPFKICRPSNLEELKDTLKQAAAANCAVRAVGSGHSWSDAALTDGFLIETHGMANQIPLDAATLRDGAKPSMLFQVEAGITIRQLNTLLDQNGLALINMGGYDGQTVAGVISTSTHGSGLQLGSFPALAEALIVVTADGEVLQIEKQNGISDPAGFAEKYRTQRKLCQDDQLFNALAVGVGCLGVIYAVVLRVTAKYWLTEVRKLLPWNDVKEQLRAGGILQEFRHVEVLLNPYKFNGEHLCLLTTRKEDDDPGGPVIPRPFRDVFAEFLASLPGADRVLAFLFNEFPSLTPVLLHKGLRDLEDENPYTDLSYRILNVGAVNAYKGVSCEFGVDLELQVDAADAILQAAENFASLGTYHSCPVAMRWVAASPGFLSLQPRPTCMFEIPGLLDVFGSDELCWRYENLLTSRFKARPHWGQRNFLTGGHDMVRQLYPDLDKWLSVYQSFNKDGRFSSKFTDRVGFTSHAPKPAAGTLNVNRREAGAPGRS